jgi:quinol monooxygenase YgiN
MILQFVTFPIKPDKKAEFEKALTAQIEASNKEDGVSMYVGGWKLGDDSKMLLVEEYPDQAGLDAHLEAEHTKNLLAGLDQYLSARPELRVYQVDSLNVQEI